MPRAGRLAHAVLLVALAATAAAAGHGAGALVPGYRAEHVKQMLEGGEAAVLIDVRPLAAYRAARLPGARSVPLAELAARAREVPRAGRVILYGETIADAHDAYTVLRDQGYRNVGVLEDGFAGWRRSGFPIER
jgi:rhodanese-related sulfurtransferase